MLSQSIYDYRTVVDYFYLYLSRFMILSGDNITRFIVFIMITMVYFLFTVVSDQSGNQLELKCGIGSTITTNTTQSAEKTTKVTQTTIPSTTMTITTTKTMPITTTLPTTTITTTVPTTTITETTKITEIDTNVFEIANSTSTDGSVTTNPKNKPDDTGY